MKNAFTLTLILAFILFSKAAIDAGFWELVETDVEKVTFFHNQMFRLRKSGENPLGFPVELLKSDTQRWIECTDDYFATTYKLTTVRDYILNKYNLFFFRVTGISEWFADSSVDSIEFDVNDQFLWWVSPTHELFRRSSATHQTESIDWNKLKVAVHPTGSHAWTVNQNGGVSRCTDTVRNNWRADARNIAVTSDDVPYIVSSVVRPEGFAIKKLISDTWEEIQGIAGIFLAFDQENNLYVVTNDHKLYRQKGVISRFCPRCGSPDFGYCTPAKDKCLNCPQGTTVMTTPALSCVSCESNCIKCEIGSPSMCTACASGFLLTSNGKCISPSLCISPAIQDPINNRCRGPCDDSISGNFYYPAEQICRHYCGVPFSADPNIFYPRCSFCSTTNCLECFPTTSQCSKCFSPQYLNVIVGFGQFCAPFCASGTPVINPDGSRQCI